MSRVVQGIERCRDLPAGVVLPAGFFARPSSEVAAELVGKVVWRSGFGGGRLTEVEAYLPEGDPASHSAGGKTKRNSAMFGPAGCLYVFLSYGVHRLLNIVCDQEAVGSAVLIRSYEPLASEGRAVPVSASRGPGRVGNALGIRLEMSGLPLGTVSGVFVIDDGYAAKVGRTARVGISHGGELLLRYHLIGSDYVSGPARLIGGGRR
jgi:DNA-3-methyladenine glycosylase